MRRASHAGGGLTVALDGRPPRLFPNARATTHKEGARAVRLVPLCQLVKRSARTSACYDKAAADRPFFAVLPGGALLT